MIHLNAIDFRNVKNNDSFPFNLPIINDWNQLSFNNPVTFFVGENGSGKSTLMSAIACAIGSITVGSENVKTDLTSNDVRLLSKMMRLSWIVRTHRGFFLRAEDFFGYIKQLSKTRAELEHDLNNLDKTYKNRSAFTQSQARMPFSREIADLKSRYGDGLEKHSHGESYLEFFQDRFVPGGLYLLDEPEAALSPLRQFGFNSLLKDLISQDSQFIISTHSPILMAFPESTIFSFDHVPIKEIGWKVLEHVSLTRDFLNSPDEFLRHL